MESIEVLVPLKGIATGKTTPKISASGFQGESCRMTTDKLLNMLGTVQTDMAVEEVVHEENPQQLGSDE